MPCFEYPVIIGVGHIGRDGRVKLGAAADLLQNASWFQMDTETAVLEYFQQNNMGLYLTFRQMDLLRLPVYGETVRVKSWVYGCDRLFGWRNSVIYDSQGAICVASIGMGAFVDLAKGLPARLPPELLDSVIRSDPLDMEALPRKIPVPPDMAIAGEALRVQSYHLDNYGHMNNARYLDVASACLPDGFSPRRLRIEYKRPAQQGDLIQPCRGMMDKALVVTLNAPDGAVFAAVEFQG